MRPRRTFKTFAWVVGVVLFVASSPLKADDTDGDGVDDLIDVCNNTPAGTAVDAEGRPLGDIDKDCDTDMDDFVLFQQGMTGPLSLSTGMILIPAGVYVMGDHHDGFADAPEHPVYVDAFYVGRYEITNQQYADALNWAYGQGGQISVQDGVVYRAGAGTTYPYCQTHALGNGSRIHWDGNTFTVTAGKENHPMGTVSWYGACRVCELVQRAGGSNALLRSQHLELRLRGQRVSPADGGRMGICDSRRPARPVPQVSLGR